MKFSQEVEFYINIDIDDIRERCSNCNSRTIVFSCPCKRYWLIQGGNKIELQCSSCGWHKQVDADSYIRNYLHKAGKCKIDSTREEINKLFKPKQ